MERVGPRRGPLSRVLGTALACCSCLWGCGQGSTGGTALGHEASKSAAQIFADSERATASAASVQIVGSAQGQGQTFSFDVVDGAGGGGGTFNLDGAVLQVVHRGGALYVEAGATTWQTLGAPAREARVVAGHWVKVKDTVSDLKPVAQLTSLATMMSNVDASQLTGRGPVTVYRGRRAIELTGSGGDILYVALDGPPYWLGGSATSPKITLTFSDYSTATIPSTPTSFVDATSMPGGS